jgi:hypothetical protein
MNAVILEGKPVGESILQGEGAGPGPTSSSLLSDLLSILSGNVKKPFGIPNNKRRSIKCYNVNNYINSLYLRFEAKDIPGVLSTITNRLAKYKISVKRKLQNRQSFSLNQPLFYSRVGIPNGIFYVFKPIQLALIWLTNYIKIETAEGYYLFKSTCLRVLQKDQ